MRRIIDTSEVLGSVDQPEPGCEVCAVAEAGYDEEQGQLVIRLAAFLRSTDLRTKERRFSADWLPRPETITERVSADEAGGLARDVFHRWVRKVREAMLAAHPAARS